jgi:hypothetical protein
MTPGGPPVDRRSLSYATEADAADDVRRLRNGYRRAGAWTLPQVCNHVAGAIERMLAANETAPASVPPVDPEARGYLASVLSSGRIPSGRPAPAVSIPPGDCTDAELDRLLAALDQLRGCRLPEVVAGRFGRVTIAEARQFHLIHAAHHLSHLVPNV